MKAVQHFSLGSHSSTSVQIFTKVSCCKGRSTADFIDRCQIPCIYFITSYTELPVLGLVLFLVHPCILLLECADLHSPFREINASFHPPLFFPLLIIFLVSLLSPLLGEQLMRNKPLRHIRPYKKARAVIQWLSFSNPFSFKWLV